MTIFNNDVEVNKKIISFETRKPLDFQIVTLHNGEPLTLMDSENRIHKIFLVETDVPKPQNEKH